MKKILLIEDEPLIAKSLKKLLEKRNFDVTTEGHGNKAIELIMNNNYNRIICDLMLGDISGFDIIEESKKKYSFDELSQLFVIITAYSSDQIIDKAEVYGCRVLKKPFDDINEAIDIFTQTLL